MMRLILLVVLLGMTSGTMAQESAPTTGPRAQAEAHPVLPERATWAGSVVIVIIGMFVAAAVIGVVVRLNMPEQPPEPAPHDDHGHGHDDHGNGGGHGGHAGGHGH